MAFEAASWVTWVPRPACVAKNLAKRLDLSAPASQHHHGPSEDATARAAIGFWTVFGGIFGNFFDKIVKPHYKLEKAHAKRNGERTRGRSKHGATASSTAGRCSVGHCRAKRARARSRHRMLYTACWAAAR